jgi:hypothetical protein
LDLHNPFGPHQVVNFISKHNFPFILISFLKKRCKSLLVLRGIFMAIKCPPNTLGLKKKVKPNIKGIPKENDLG